MGTADPIRGGVPVDTRSTSETTPRGMTFGTLVPFMAIAFGLTWGIFALLIAFPERMAATFGPVGYTNPIFVLAVYSPAIAAFLLVWRHYGLAGVGSFLRRLTLWRMPVAWWLFLVFGILAVFYIGAMLRGEPFDPFPFSPWYTVLPAAATALIIGPIEEFGWRGVALPLLQRRLAPLWAGLILGAIWAIWHIPAFLVHGTPQSAWSLTPFLIGVTVIAVILTPMFNAARGAPTHCGAVPLPDEQPPPPLRPTMGHGDLHRPGGSHRAAEPASDADPRRGSHLRPLSRKGIRHGPLTA
jgi:membrane protease YdiL (CAAX protease family)